MFTSLTSTAFIATIAAATFITSILVRTTKNESNIIYLQNKTNKLEQQIEKKTNELEWKIENKSSEYYELKNNINKFCNSSLEQLVIQSNKQHSIIANNLVEFCKQQLNKK